ncbi:hypothetical protein C5D04_17510 [Rathayibacter sp. AY1D2]|uniref:hypothetical protein n=1 Tax=unclassified Rathayibacter TaxID=2609250 RepID=UPI000CE764F3|nr:MULTISPECIES: hypothetical protein [unclassified Rathayibacter]PPG79267.1 hypothetical protein C5C52_12560 [Rathayibacter sp. AY1E5]PPH18463.1 hypothetical protein C5C99_13745 [Rathayibacter sp. AY1C4]PPH43744.1 hypothetical protein C5D09_14635 [Rathayibacter sp. AY1C9]PPH65108.1 hypothetical protein C5D25_04615 [Rathayibacter sp. AY1D7]PPH96813.1 hypothetical protein C5C56_13760 [Rathayibacter sp. AY1D1]
MTEQPKADAVTIYLAAADAYDEAVTAFLTAGATYTAALANFRVAMTVSPTLSCEKVNVIAQMLDKAGDRDAAGWWIHAHCAEEKREEFEAHMEFYLEDSSWL